MPQIFISYRSSDTQEVAFRLYEMLANEFGSESIFLDKHSLPLGEHFPSYLGRQISNADVIIVLIGLNWNGGRDYRQEFRIMNKSDYVGKEVRYAMLRNEEERTPVIPVLVGISDFTSFWVPDDFKKIKMLNAHFFSKALHKSEFDSLIESIGRLPTRSSNSIQLPKILDQDVHIHARVNLWGGLRHPYPVPSDSYALVEKDGNKWALEIQSEMSPRFNLNRFSIATDILKDRPIEEVFGAIMEWYEIPRSKWVIKSFNKSKSSIGSLMGKKVEFEWVKHHGNSAYSILHFLVLDFEALFVNEDIGRSDVLYQSHTPIGGGYSVFGLLGDSENPLFGKYICSLTNNLGGVDIENQTLYYFPSFPGTNLQYVDLYKTPQFKDIVYCGHVGLDRNGYHIYFVA